MLSTFSFFVLSLLAFLRFMCRLRSFGRLSFQHVLRFFVALSDLCNFTSFFHGLLLIANRRKFDPEFLRRRGQVVRPDFLFFLGFLVFLSLWKGLLQLLLKILRIDCHFSFQRNPNLVTFRLLITPLFLLTLYFFYAYLQIILHLISIFLKFLLFLILLRFGLKHYRFNIAKFITKFLYFHFSLFLLLKAFTFPKSD